MALATGLVMALPTPVHAQASRHYDIPAGPLDTALNRFALQAGIALVIDAEKLKGLRSAGLQGDYDVDTGFAALLRNTGYNVARTPSGYILVEAPKANAAPIAGTGETQLPTLVVTDVREPMGTTVIDRRTIEALPVGNGDITSLLKIHPNVQFDKKQMSSNSPGEISAADISINGAKYYQNAFMLDGMNINNDIDPGERTASRINSLSDVPGQSQGLSLDTDLLEKITVYDSNVPASYGRFNGGVIEATTRKPTRDLHGKFSVQTTRSSWTRYHIDERAEESFENSADIYDQPKFDKMIYRGTLEGYLTENFGLIANFSQKRSTIPTSFYSANNVSKMGFQERDQKRSIDNYFVKAVWKPISRLDLESSIAYAPEENTYWRGNIANSAFENRSGGLQFNLKASYDGDLVKLEQNLGYGKLELSKRSDSDDYYAWRRSTSKFWGTTAASSLEGGYGDIDQTQDTWQYRLNADWQAFSLLGSNHRLQSGMEISRQSVRYERLTENSTYVTPITTSTCTNSSGVVVDACAMGATETGNWPGQLMSSRTRFAKGDFEFTTTQWAAWLQDDIEIGRLNLRPGVRVDSDDYMDKTTWSPRFAVRYDLFADNSTVFNAGANRYYGRNLTVWRLSEGRNRLRYNNEKRTSVNSGWTVGTQAADTVKFSQLDIPYDDELMFGIEQRWQGFKFDAKYIKRKGRDQVIEVKGSTLGQTSPDPTTLSNTYTTWTNGGKSETDILSLSISPLQDLRWQGTRTNGQLVLDWTDSKKNAPDYYSSTDTATDLYLTNPYIQYKGKLIHYTDRPVDNYTRPWTLRLATVTQIPQWNLTWSNFLRYRAAYSKIAQTVASNKSGVVDHNGNPVAIWGKRKFNNALTWDIRLGWEFPTARDQAFFVNVDVFNVLDKKSAAENSSMTDTGITTYEVGRQFWLEVGYRF
jgi:hypothetical protein